MPHQTRSTRKAILGKKVGMTQIFTEEGKWVPVTVLQAGPCTVLQVKTAERDGYDAVQLGFDDTDKPRKKPQQAFYDRLGVRGQRFVREVPFVDPADLQGTGSGTGAGASSGEGASAGGEGASEGGEGGEGASEAAAVTPGALLRVTALKGVARVDVRGVTKGRGFAGTIKRHSFQAGDKSHGSKNVREPGSTGMHTDPGRVIKGKRMPGQYGNALRKARNLTVIGIEEEDNLLLVEGAVPGRNGGYVYIEESLR